MTTMKNMMRKKPISLKNFRRDQESIKESFLSSVSIVAKLATFNPNVLIPKRTLRMKMPKVSNTKREENPTIRKTTKEKRTSIQKKKKTAVH